MLKSRRFWIGAIISLVLLALFIIINWGSFGEIGDKLAGARYVFILPAVAVLVIDMGLKALRWQYLLRPLKAISLRSVFSIEVIGHMANAILPLRLGELVRAYLLGEKESVSKISTLATVAVARAFDGLALLFVAAVLALFLPLEARLKLVVYIAAAIILGVLVVFLLLASTQGRLERVAARLLRPLPRRWSARLEGWLDRFICGLEAIKSPRKVLLVFLISILVWLAEGTMFYIVSFAFNLGQPFHVMLLASTAANLALLIPSSPGGFGAFEIPVQQALVIFGVESALAGAYAFAVHVALLLPVVLFGFFFLWVENISLAEVARRPAKAAAPPGSEECDIK